MYRFFALAIIFMYNPCLKAQRLVVHESGRHLVTEEGKPFFWMADTAWELFHRCTREEADLYLAKRASQGFNVIQAVVLAELDGLNAPNPYGAVPLIDKDPLRPNEKYFEHVDFIVDRANELGLYIALLPTWGDKLYSDSWGIGPEVLDVENARGFGEWIGKRYRERDNLIWIIGGDRNPREGSQDIEVWNALAEGITEGVGGYDRALMSFHPQPRAGGGSSTWFHEERWLDFNMHQTGHCADHGTYAHIDHDYALLPAKPVLDGEPLYEDHPNCFNAKELGYSIPGDIRRIMYWNVFAGACGQTYGCHDVWQMYKLDRAPINGPLRPWTEALDLPMANQVGHLKDLMLSRPFLARIPDQSMIVGSQTEEMDHVSSTRDVQGRYAMIYFPKGGKAHLDLTALSPNRLFTWWYDPRTGNSFRGENLKKSDKVEIEAPTSGKGHDWVLVIDSEKFDAPGKTDYYDR